MLTKPYAFNHALDSACCSAGVRAMCHQLLLLTPCWIAVFRLTPKFNKLRIFVRTQRHCFQ